MPLPSARRSATTSTRWSLPWRMASLRDRLHESGARRRPALGRQRQLPLDRRCGSEAGGQEGKGGGQIAASDELGGAPVRKALREAEGETSGSRCGKESRQRDGQKVEIGSV